VEINILRHRRGGGAFGIGISLARRGSYRRQHRRRISA